MDGDTREPAAPAANTNSTSAGDNTRLSTQTRPRSFDDHDAGSRCQESALSPENGDCATGRAPRQHCAPYEGTRLTSEGGGGGDSDPAKPAQLVCSRRALECRGEPELLKHVCLGEDEEGREERDGATLNTSLKRRHCVGTEEQEAAIDDNDSNHGSHRWAFPTAGAEMVARSAAPVAHGSERCGPAGARLSVITPRGAVLSHHRGAHRSLSQHHLPSIAANSGARGAQPSLGAAHPASGGGGPSELRGGLRAPRRGAAPVSPQPLPTPSPPRHALGREPEDQRRRASASAQRRDMARCQTPSPHEAEPDHNAPLPIKKRCVAPVAQ